VTNAVPHYRAAFFGCLLERSDIHVQVFCQASLPGMHVETRHGSLADRVTLVDYVGMSRERIGWQRLPWRHVLSSYDVLVVAANPRVLSNVVLASLARLLGKSVVLYGQAHTAGAHRFTEQLRLWWWRQFDHLLVYTDGEVQQLRARGFKRQHLVGINNGLDQLRIDEAAAAWNGMRLAAWQASQTLMGRTVVLSCARLEPKNRFDLWLEAMPAVVSRFPGLLWCVIGDGRQRDALEGQARRLGLVESIRWMGAILDESELAPWFLSSALLVHPAGIGLSLLHAFGYGLPVVTHDDASTQMPEFDAFVPGETGFLYEHGQSASLARVVGQCLADPSARHRMGTRARQIAREQYNVQVMAERFARMARDAARRGGLSMSTVSRRSR
jgi:glycosyltransferase involved in cell wall biosynthesis